MFLGKKAPLDKKLYPRSPDSRPLTIGEETGRFVSVVDVDEKIHVAPDGSHQHPRVLGQAQPALYAGDLEIDHPGHIATVTNCSGTFQFSDQKVLCCVATRLHRLGFVVDDVTWFPPDGSTLPIPIQCS